MRKQPQLLALQLRLSRSLGVVASHAKIIGWVGVAYYPPLPPTHLCACACGCDFALKTRSLLPGAKPQTWNNIAGILIGLAGALYYAWLKTPGYGAPAPAVAKSSEGREDGRATGQDVEAPLLGQQAQGQGQGQGQGEGGGS